MVKRQSYAGGVSFERAAGLVEATETFHLADLRRPRIALCLGVVVFSPLSVGATLCRPILLCPAQSLSLPTS